MSFPSGGIRVLPGGASVLGGGAGAFVRRFVSVAGVPTLAGNTRTQVNSSGATETVLENPTGPVQGGSIPADAIPAGFLEAGDGGRFGSRVRVLRIGNVPVLSGTRAEGSFQAPTPPGNAFPIFQVVARPVVDAATGASAEVARVLFVTREAMSATAYGSAIRMQAGRVGTTTVDSLFDFQSGGAGIAELVSRAATSRYVPATTGQLRNPANTATHVEWNATGLGFFGVAPVARSAAIPDAAGGATIDVEARAALNALLAYLRVLGPITP